MDLYHHSQHDAFRSPGGAVPVGTSIRIRLQAWGHPGQVALRTWNSAEEYSSMQPVGMGLYEGNIVAPSHPCVLWYDFMVEDERGHRLYYGNARDGLGGAGLSYQDPPPSYQITVYDPSFNPPSYLREGVMYQVFPDRFARSKAPVSSRSEVFLHQNWQEDPLVDPDPRSGDNRALDFFGGDLRGITNKLSYLQDLGITVLYLNPVFKARSNHRYDTGDYSRIDPLLGTEEDFRVLCLQAKQKGIRIILDGVFSHTGEDSLYFNRFGHYPDTGAFQSKTSPYYPWYRFTHFPDQYASWWGIPSLPELNKEDPSYREFICGNQGIVRGWIQKGASGWRLDVADELPVSFIQQLRKATKGESAQSVLIGEVWEDASNKVSYGSLRSYCLGDTLDSVMNYPLREVVIGFLTGLVPAERVVRVIRSLQENYPTPFFYSLMNLMGSHDRPRILNVLCGNDYSDLPTRERGLKTLPQVLRELAIARFSKMLAIYTALPGMPSLYYGDEAGMEGAADPFCRRPFPWGQEDEQVRALVKEAFQLRHSRPVLKTGFLDIASEGSDTLLIVRSARDGCDAFGNPLKDPAYILRVTRDSYRTA